MPSQGSAPVSALSYIDHVADYMHTNQRLQDVPSLRQFPTEVPMYLPIKGWPGAKLGIKSVSNKSTRQDHIQKTDAPFWLKQLLSKADINHHSHNRRWCTFFKPVPFLANKTLNFGFFLAGQHPNFYFHDFGILVHDWPVFVVFSFVYFLFIGANDAARDLE